jgi:YD repeat-containing protein
MPPSPTSSTLAKFVDVPVNHYTGAANVSVPLFSIREKDIPIDITLNHHTSGIKLDEAPGWVGQNWALNTGVGFISRTVAGLADEAPNGFLNRHPEIQTIANNTSPDLNTWYEILKDYSYNNFDSQPDIFFLSIPDYNVKFYLKPNGVMTIPYTKLIITPTIADNQITAFTVKTPNGLTYNFNNPESSQIAESPGDYIPYSWNSSWYPSSIVSANGHNIQIQYHENQNVSFLAGYSRSRHDKFDESGIALSEAGLPLSCPANSITGGGFGIIVSNARKVKKIITTNGYIEFFLSNDRQDTGQIYEVSSMIFAESKLNKIEWHDALGALVKGFNLGYSYYGPNVGKRMFLTSVTEFGRNLAALPPTSFTYEESYVPAIFSNSQDHWGFQNSSAGHIYRIPEMTWNGKYYTGVNKETDQNFLGPLLGGSLKKVKYPTGGTTEFTYESHKQTVNGSEVSIGGLRVKEIKNTDPVESNSYKKTYLYDSGFLLDIPKYDHTQWIRIGDQQFSSSGQYKRCDYLVRTSKSMCVLGAGAHIVYLKVTEYNSTIAENGKTVYTYTSPQTPVVHDFPFPPQSDVSIIGGVLAGTAISNSSDQLLWQEEKFFNDSPNNTNNAAQMKAFVIGRNYEWSSPFPLYQNLNTTYNGLFTIRQYDIWQRWWYMNKKEVMTFNVGDAARNVKTTTNYFYENPTHAQVTKETSVDSKGNSFEKTYKYPHDFSATLPYSEMMNNNVFMISAVVETQEKVANANTSYRKFEYEKVGGARYLPKRVKSKLGSGSEYEEIVYNTFDNRGNPTQYKERNGVTTNLEYFAAGDFGKADLLKKRTVAPGTDSEQITEYDYKPEAGMSSTKDPDGKTTKYEYDNFNRLKTIKNSSDQVKASYCYNYAGQAVPCADISPAGVITPASLSLLGDSAEPSLPVTLIEFKASKEEKSTLLTWSTTDENNSAYFEVQRTVDGANWTAIGKVAARGESVVKLDYSYRDVLPAKGDNLYRLRMVDQDGTFAYSRILAINFDGENDVVIYPNPISVNDELYIGGTDAAKITKVDFYNTKGGLVLSSSAKGSINMQNLDKGLYIVKIVLENGTTLTHRIVKQ